MVAQGEGRILITGSVAGLIPGSYQAVYNGTKAYLDSFSYALREELKDTGVSVTVLMPGPTDTEFFRRADMLDTPVGKDDSKEDPAKTARNGWDAMMDGLRARRVWREERDPGGTVAPDPRHGARQTAYEDGEARMIDFVR